MTEGEIQEAIELLLSERFKSAADAVKVWAWRQAKDHLVEAEISRSELLLRLSHDVRPILLRDIALAPVPESLDSLFGMEIEWTDVPFEVRVTERYPLVLEGGAQYHSGGTVKFSWGYPESYKFLSAWTDLAHATNAAAATVKEFTMSWSSHTNVS